MASVCILLSIVCAKLSMIWISCVSVERCFLNPCLLFLNMGTTLAVVQYVGIIRCFNEAWKNSVNVGVSSSSSVLSSFGGYVVWSCCFVFVECP